MIAKKEAQFSFPDPGNDLVGPYMSSSDPWRGLITGLDPLLYNLNTFE